MTGRYYTMPASGNLDLVQYLEKQEGVGPIVTKQFFGWFPWLIRTDQTWTVLHSAAMSGNLELVKYLVEKKGADPKAEMKTASPYKTAAEENDHTDIVDYLKNIIATK